MRIENVVCPLCNEEIRIGVPYGKEITQVLIATYIFTSLTRKFDHRMHCPKCTIEVFVRFA